MTRVWGLLVLLVSAAGPLHADDLQDAYKAFEKGQFDEAAQAFQKHAQKKPQDYDQLYNAGVALAQKGDWAGAIPYFDRASQSPDPQLKSRSAYNKGVAYAQQQRWDDAVAAFQDALSFDNDNRVIQENLQFAREQKLRQKQEPEQNQAQKNAQQSPAEQKDVQQTPAEKKDVEQLKQTPAEQKQALKEDEQGDKKATEDGQKSAEALKDAAQEQKAWQEQKAQDAQAQGEEKAGQEGSMAQQEKAEGPEKKAAMAAGEPQGAAAAKGEEQQVLTIKELKKQEAEKLLRSVDDRIGKYILTPEQANTEGKSRNGKDW